MAGSSRRRFSKEFKLDAGPLVTERGHSVSWAASELSISNLSIRGWIRTLQTSGELKVNNQTESAADELKRLRAKDQRLQMQKEMLKKPRQSHEPSAILGLSRRSRREVPMDR